MLSFIDFIKSDGEDELTFPLIAVNVKINYQILLWDNPNFIGTVTSAEVNKFSHMFVSEDSINYFMQINNSEELDFAESTFDDDDELFNFKIGQKCAVKDFGIYMGIQ